jgi:type II secretory pathway predicted ATPase ExeA
MTPSTGEAPTVDVSGPDRHLPFYGLARPPFRSGADPGRLWLGAGHHTVIETLAGAIRDREGIVLLTGDAGTGKTSLAQRAVATLGRAGLSIGWVSGTGAAPSDFFEAVLSAYGVRHPVHDKDAFAASFQRVLARADANRDKLLLIIDEAQGLGPEILHEIGELSVMASEGRRPLVIVLVGETRLHTELREERHAVVRQRVVARCAVPPLGVDEVGAYIRHCLDAAGAVREVFSPEAIRHIASLSRGAPGTINIICDRALLAGRAKRIRPITEAIVVACYRPPGSPAPVNARRQPWTRRPVSFPARSGGRRRLYVTVAATVLLVTGAPYLTWWLVGPVDRAPRTMARPRPDTPSQAGPAAALDDPARGEAPALAASSESEAPSSAEQSGPASMGTIETPAMLPARALSVRPRSVHARESIATRQTLPPNSVPGVPTPGLNERASAGVPAAPLPAERSAAPVRAGRMPPLASPAPPPTVSTTTAETPAPRPPAAPPRADSPDPSAIIDWLVKESPGRR